jgi:hypothetical protein
MSSLRVLLAAGVLAGLAFAPGLAQADPPCGYGWRRGEWCGHYYHHRDYRGPLYREPLYREPLYREPVYLGPPHVIVAPPPVYYAPRVYTAPPPAVYAPPDAASGVNTPLR